jgi:hypothetical protein
MAENQHRLVRLLEWFLGAMALAAEATDIEAAARHVWPVELRYDERSSE